MEQLTLKSKMTSAYDYKSIDISQFAIPLKADQVRYERDLKNFCKRFAAKKEVTDIESQDMVTISCSSENPKYKKEHVTVRVGLGLYSKELEQKLIGMPVGATETLTVSQDSVTVIVEKSVREIIPELTDELVAACGIPYVKTVNDVYAYCRFKQYDDALEEAADNAYAYFAAEILNHSSFDLDEEELEITRRHISGMMNESMERMEAEDENSGFLTHDMIVQMGNHTLMSAVLGQKINPLTKQDYEEYLSKRAVAKECTVEKIRDEYPVTLYLIDTYTEIFSDTIEAHVLWKLKEIGETL